MSDGIENLSRENYKNGLEAAGTKHTTPILTCMQILDLCPKHIEGETRWPPCIFTDDIFMCIFSNENFWISNKITLQYVL